MHAHASANLAKQLVKRQTSSTSALACVCLGCRLMMMRLLWLRRDETVAQQTTWQPAIGNRHQAPTEIETDRQTDSALWAHTLWLFWLHTHWIYENSKPNETKIDLVSRLRNLLEFCGCAGGGNGLESRTASRSIEGSTDCVGCKETSRSSDQSVWRMNQLKAWRGMAWHGLVLELGRAGLQLCQKEISGCNLPKEDGTRRYIRWRSCAGNFMIQRRSKNMMKKRRWYFYMHLCIESFWSFLQSKMNFITFRFKLSLGNISITVGDSAKLN